MKTWKAAEMAFAKRIGGTRGGAVGREGPDVIHPLLAPEVKERRGKPWVGLHKFMEQAERNAPEGKIPLVVLHTLGELHDQDLVVMRVRDWLGTTDYQVIHPSPEYLKEVMS